MPVSPAPSTTSTPPRITSGGHRPETSTQAGGAFVRVTVRLFALAKQTAGRAEVALELPEGATVADLKRVMAGSYPAPAPLVPNLMIAVDAEYAQDDRLLAAGSE